MAEMKDYWSNIGVSPADVAELDQYEAGIVQGIEQMVTYMADLYRRDELVPAVVFGYGAALGIGLDPSDENDPTTRLVMIAIYCLQKLAKERVDGREEMPPV